MKKYKFTFRFIFPTVLVLIGISIIFVLLAMTKHIQHEMVKIAGKTHMILQEQAHDKAYQSLLHINASTFNIAQILGSLKFTNASSFASIQNQVFPLLFEAYTMLLLVSQISYVSKDKHMLSYYMDGNQTYALFSNSSNTFVSQNVNITNGERYGEEITLPQHQTNASKWPDDALDGTSGYTYWGVSYGREKQKMLFFTASTPNRNGVISLGISMENYRNHVLFNNTYNYGTRMYLSSSDGYIYEYNGVVPNSFNSSPEQFNSFCHAKIENSGRKQLFDCSSFNIGGTKMVIAAITHIKEIFNIEHVEALNIGILTLLCIMILGLVTESYIMLLMYRKSMKKEICLKANLIKLKEAVQQAERKSMNKSLAFASASHDVRNSLSGITGLIELCRKEVQPDSMQLNENLVQMHACASELLEIVNSVLDMSKVEAGKMQLEEAEFDISQVIEESVDLCNIAALDKGLEVLWDPCDFSILTGGASRVKGDCRRFKQILDNLLCNARKFTQSGHIVLRGWASKQNEYNSNPDLIEFVFEIDDTGIGIPKEKRESIFENYVQVKESSFQGQEGTGLGLGIVQSFVRLMGGEIGVMDKGHGEKGACFRFNIFLKAARVEDINIFESTKVLREVTEIVKARGVMMKSILLVSGDETKRVLKHFMENIGIEANIIENWEQVDPTVMKNRRVVSKRFRSSRSLNKIIVSDSKTEDETLPVSSNDASCSRRFKDSYSVYFLIFIDIDSCGGFLNMYSILDRFLKFKLENNNKLLQFKIVCLVNPNTHGADIKRLKETSCVPLRKPIHGSRLHVIIRLIQEFGGNEEEEAPYLPSEPSSKLESNDIEMNTEEQKQLDGMKLLLVEDMMVMRVIAIRVLSKLGAVVNVAENGLKALNMIKNALPESSSHCTEQGKNKHLPYDVVLMDCEMPVMNGFEAAKSIRGEEKKYGIRIPIIALTGHTDQDQINKAISAGMDLHLAKPIKEESILEAIRQAKQY